MLTKDVIAHFGSRAKVADALRLTRAAVYGWGERVPPLRAAKLAEITAGRLRFDPSDYEGYWNAGPSDAA